MTIDLMFKCPGACDELHEFMRTQLFLKEAVTYDEREDLTDEEIEDRFLAKFGFGYRQLTEKIGKFVQFGECVTISIDLDAETAQIKNPR